VDVQCGCDNTQAAVSVGTLRALVTEVERLRDALKWLGEQSDKAMDAERTAHAATKAELLHEQETCHSAVMVGNAELARANSVEADLAALKAQTCDECQEHKNCEIEWASQVHTNVFSCRAWQRRRRDEIPKATSRD
jgi:hypothetical protein